MSLSGRRLRSVLILLSVLGLVALWLEFETTQLRNPAWVSGYLLLSALLVLTSLHWRKRLIVLPLGSVSQWMQVHLYVGWGSLVLFAWHLPRSWPNGGFETSLYLAFLSVAGSGILGLWWTRAIPKQLSRLRHQVRYEEIPFRRQRLSERARTLVLRSAESTSVIADFYLTGLDRFFQAPRRWRYRLIPSMSERKGWESATVQLDRYLTSGQREWRRELSAMIGEKDDLDFHESRQGLLKAWIVVHLTLTYVLWSLVAIHVVLVHAFQGT